VPYPFAIGTEYVYLLDIENAFIPLSSVTNLEDPYDEYYKGENKGEKLQITMIRERMV
jgi:hypothetical protein